jgi:hypothetical protein
MGLCKHLIDNDYDGFIDQYALPTCHFIDGIGPKNR